jgi:pyruvate,water dikinase
MIRRDVRQKDRRIVRDPSRLSGTHVEPVPTHLRAQPVLTERQIRQLRDLGVRIESRFGTAQDIEWAFDDRGTLFVLQARPVTPAGTAPVVPRLRVWDNSNIVESYPGLTLPLTFSFACAAYEATFRHAALGLVLRKREMRRHDALYRTMIGLLHGRVYYNLLNWYELLSFLPGFTTYRKAWEEMIGLSQKTVAHPQRLSLINQSACFLAVLWRLAAVRHIARRFFASFDRVYAAFRDVDFSSANEDEALATYETLERTLAGRWHLTLYNDFCAIRYYGWLRQLCRRWGLEAYPNLPNDLLRAQNNVESVAPVCSLIRLAEQCYAVPRCRQLLADGDPATIWTTIQHDPACAALRGILDSHLRQFGDRGVEELRLDRPSFREEPSQLIRLIQEYQDRGPT